MLQIQSHFNIYYNVPSYLKQYTTVYNYNIATLLLGPQKMNRNCTSKIN